MAALLARALLGAQVNPSILRQWVVTQRGQYTRQLAGGGGGGRSGADVGDGGCAPLHMQTQLQLGQRFPCDLWDAVRWCGAVVRCNWSVAVGWCVVWCGVVWVWRGCGVGVVSWLRGVHRMLTVVVFLFVPCLVCCLRRLLRSFREACSTAHILDVWWNTYVPTMALRISTGGTKHAQRPPDFAASRSPLYNGDECGRMTCGEADISTCIALYTHTCMCFLFICEY
jgi:hypothetical protein